MGEPANPLAAPYTRAGLTPADRQLPVDSEITRPREEQSAMEGAAEKLGNAVGSAVDTVRHLPDRLQVQRRLEDMKQRFTVIKGRAQENALDTAYGVKNYAVGTAHDLKNKAQDTLADARLRANRVAREYPFAVVLGAAGLGLAIGVALRIWRDHD